MSKRLLLMLWPYKFREFDWYRHDFSNLEKEYDIEVKIHEQVDFLFPHITKVYAETLEDQRITKYKSFKKWKDDFRKIVKENSSNILVLNVNKNDNLLSFLINFELKKSKVRVLEFSSTEHPNPPVSINFLYLFKKLFSLIKNPKALKFFLNSKFFTFLGNIFNLLPTHSLKSGSETFPNYYYKKKIKIIEGNSRDYDRFLSIKKNITKFHNEEYGLFMEAPTPLFQGDNLMSGKKKSEFGTPEKWFPALNFFFDNLEDLLKIKIKIAPHPKVKHKQFPDYYGGREVIKKKLAEAAAFSSLLITRDSGGLSYATLYKKPAMMIYSKELISNIKFIREQKYFAGELGIKPINIDDLFDSKKILNHMNLNEKKYNEYKFKYLTTRKDEKPNYKIIGDLLTESD